MKNDIKIFKIIADYRPKSPNNPCYYVKAESARQAKKRFLAFMSWLKVYNVELCNEEETEKIMSEPERYLFRYPMEW